MTDVWFIRHGESAANSGARTETPDSIPLTAHGHQQAAYVATLYDTEPDLIVASPYIRTQDTAAPTLDRFPLSAHEIWPIQEFSYLDVDKHRNTSFAERAPFAAAYWERGDVHYKDGPDCESFSDLLERVHQTIRRIEQSPHNFIAVYSHGLFMHTLEVVLQHPEISPSDVMKRIGHIRVHAHMPNVHVIKTQVQNGLLKLANDNNPPSSQKPSNEVPKWQSPSPK